MRPDLARKDLYRRMAKSHDYRSRATFKLLQMDRKYGLFKPGQVVIDFGCAPGGWLQHISKAIAPHGVALGIDLKEVKPLGPNVKLLIRDVNDQGIEEKILSLLPKKADVITSDLSPNLTGIWDLDVEKQIGLTSRVLELMPTLLEKRGTTVMKVFEGGATKGLLERLKKGFKRTMLVKPQASRAKSSEIYIIGLDYCK